MSMTEEQKQAIIDAAIELAESYESYSNIIGAPNHVPQLRVLINSVKAAQQPEFQEGELAVRIKDGFILQYNSTYHKSELYRKPNEKDLKQMHPTGCERLIGKPSGGMDVWFCIPLPEEGA